MRENKIFILKIGLSNLNLYQILEEIKKRLEKPRTKNQETRTKDEKPLIIFTPNPEIMVYAQKDEKFREIVNSAQINIPDGQGIIWASQILGKPLPERISGTDLAEKLVKLAGERGFTVGLIGGGPGIALKALECLQKKYSRLSGWAEKGPRLEADDRLWMMDSGTDINKWGEKIRERKTDILLVGMGAPKQEYFINYLLNTKYLILNTPLVVMAVGGAFDYFAGRLPRAPQWLQNLGLEWAFRLINQPWRIKRQLAIPKFIFSIFQEKFLAE